MVNIYLTVDVECSMGDAWLNRKLQPVRVERAILGKKEKSFYGTPLIMDILEQNGLKATFFCEVFAALNCGESELSQAYRDMIRRGHEVQLHLHPTHYFYRQVQEGRLKEADLDPNHDYLACHPLEKQVALLREGIEVFQRITGRTPTVFRAGNYGANLTTLQALEQVGIFADSSYNAAYVGKGCFLPNGRTNELWSSGTVREFPVSVFQSGIWPNIGLKPFENSSISFEEATSLLEQAAQSNMTAATAVLHCFSLFKISDRQYSDIRPDRIVIRRFERLCSWLASHKDQYRVGTFSEPLPEGGPAVLPQLSPWKSIVRKAVQAVNRAYWV